MNREKLLQLKQENKKNPILYNLIGVIIGECDTELSKQKIDKRISFEDQFLITVKKLHKVNLDNIDILSKSNNYSQIISDLNNEIFFLNQFLPKMMSDHELELVVSLCINQGMSSIKEIMNYFKNNHIGLYDGRKLSLIINRNLNK